MDRVEKVYHRINTLKAYNNCNKEYGIEIDVRYDNHSKKVILNHDIDYNINELDSFEDLCKVFKSKYMIIDVKASQCEDECIKILNKYNIDNYLFLDSQIPDIIRLTKLGYGKKFIIRLSEFEPSYNLINYTKTNYIWYDTFSVDKINYSYFNQIKDKIIFLASPDLYQNKNFDYCKYINNLKKDFNFIICTDYD